MKITATALSVSLALLTVVACERKPTVKSTLTLNAPAAVALPEAQTRTLETARLRSAIDDFERAPSDERAAIAKKAFAELDGEIAELQQRVAKTTGQDRAEAAAKMQNLTTYRAAESLRFGKAGGLSGVNTEPAVDARTGAQKLEAGAQRAGNSLERGARKVGEGLEDAADKVREAVR